MSAAAAAAAHGAAGDEFEGRDLKRPTRGNGMTDTEPRKNRDGQRPPETESETQRHTNTAATEAQNGHRDRTGRIKQTHRSVSSEVLETNAAARIPGAEEGWRQQLRQRL